MISNVIGELLETDTDVGAIVSDRIYPALAIDSTEPVDAPYIVFEVESSQPTDQKDGKSCLDVVPFTIEIYAENLTQLNDLGLKVRNVLDRHSGTTNGVEVQSIQFTAENWDYSDGKSRIYLKMQQYSAREITSYSTLARVTDLAGTNSGANQIDLTWSDIAPTAIGYEVWRSIDTLNFTLVSTTAANATTYSNTGLTTQIAYIYRIRPTDGTNGGQWSNLIAVATA